MKRFISHEDLARDRRFKRAQGQNALFASLPDDVDTLVQVMESIAPTIQERVAGTELEAVFDELGPGFTFLTNARVHKPGTPGADTQLKLQLHGIFVGELQALEAAGRTLWDFPEGPWDFKLNMARQCWDEARHVQIYEKLLKHSGAEVGDYPESTFLFETSCHDDPALRVTGVNRCLEGLACDVFRALIERSKEVGDGLTEQAVDFVLADELTHVRFGSEWVKEFTKGDPELAARTKEFQIETDRRFAFGGTRRVSRKDRLEAGFSEAELDELEAIDGGGPRRETMVRAGEILRDRHQARRRGEEVEPLG